MKPGMFFIACHRIKVLNLTHKNKTRNGFDQEVTDQLKENDVELILLIGFMRILSNEFCQNWQDKILNVHPSLLPKYAGGVDTNVHEDHGSRTNIWIDV